ncbi:hypothetical protein CF319_g944 [Tilletia indica]|uniref:Uncharacterized protein n=1 Tax=Tilletia indica TaxID=43049 RepID=A0A177TNA0_9BASI|nr:hypothetical protein CF319_g944 [Tilletia indica]KAE8253862.1 hypothetical protein A4X13_0g3630 [Tilletia indica]
MVCPTSHGLGINASSSVQSRQRVGSAEEFDHQDSTSEVGSNGAPVYRKCFRSAERSMHWVRSGTSWTYGGFLGIIASEYAAIDARPCPASSCSAQQHQPANAPSLAGQHSPMPSR